MLPVSLNRLILASISILQVQLLYAQKPCVLNCSFDFHPDFECTSVNVESIDSLTGKRILQLDYFISYEYEDVFPRMLVTNKTTGKMMLFKPGLKKGYTFLLPVKLTCYEKVEISSPGFYTRSFILTNINQTDTIVKPTLLTFHFTPVNKNILDNPNGIPAAYIIWYPQKKEYIFDEEKSAPCFKQLDKLGYKRE